MPLSQGRHFLSIPGPSVMPDRVLKAMHRGAPNIYEGEIIELTARAIAGLKKVAGTSGNAIIYIANGHGAWEAALANVLARGDRLLTLATGRFAKGWAEMARGLGAEIELIDFGGRATIDAARVEAALRARPEIRAVLMVQTDTASSVLNDVRAVRAAMDAARSDALLMVDCIASLACDEFRMDEWGADVTVAGSQKGLMTPPGLGFVFANDKAMAARRRANCVTPYWDWLPRCNPEVYYQLFCGTAPTHHLYGLDEALKMILGDEGLENVWARHRILARAIHQAVERWGATGPWELNISEPARRSAAVTSIRTGQIDAEALRRHCESEYGVTLGVGLSLGSPSAGAREEGLFRIGHMGHLNPPMLLGTLGAIEAGMTALGLPHGKGALSAAAAAIAAATPPAQAAAAQ
ncbi:MAG TPA: aminotransferase class V-fold PLP-dependent enzyme [Paracoccaceae bacterium]|nr:aminotransferase class V-fold PLP-dependent enzyme [Paracoccaceae bacterium]